jgi:hypothetical protein
MKGFIYRIAIRIKEFGERHQIGFIARLGINLQERI